MKKEVILGLRKNGTKHFVRDVILKVRKGDSLNIEYAEIDLSYRQDDEEIENHLMRGLHEYLRGNITYSREKAGRILDDFVFKDFYSSDDILTIGISKKAVSNSCVYKQVVDMNDGYYYLGVRVIFESDENYISVKSTNLSDLETGRDVNITKEYVNSILNSNIQTIVKDTLLIYGIYLKYVETIDEKERKEYLGITGE